MKATELRLGNLVLNNEHPDVPKRIRSKYVKCNIENIDEWELFEPIPLTEKWLKNFGFDCIDIIHSDKSVSKGVFKKYPAIIENNILDEGETPYIFSRIPPSEMNKRNFFCFVRYVHQLQNLYFALTGNEL